MRSIEHIAILIAALGLLLGTAGCPSDDDDDSAGDDDAADDDAGDDDAGDDDAGDDDGAGTDADGDGFTDDVDCDDGDPDVNPDATEFCYDEIDNNCDGDIDEADADDCAVNDAEIVVEGDGATVTIPVGAVMGDISFTVEETAEPRALPAECSTPLTGYYQFSPGNVHFATAAGLVLPESGNAPVRGITLLWWNEPEQDWEFSLAQPTYADSYYTASIPRTAWYVCADCNQGN